MSRVRIVADSIAENGARLTTLVVPLWRPLLAEFNTHRMLSRNSASSRAIPTAVFHKRVFNTPFMISHLGKNQGGMRAGAPLDDGERSSALALWLDARYAMLEIARKYELLGVHKSISNRLLEPWIETEIVVTATEWENFLSLRTERAEDGTPMAEPHFAERAEEILDALNASQPRGLYLHEWHLPFLRERELANLGWGDRAAVDLAIKISVARCARVSYLKHDQTEATAEEDARMHDVLLGNGHVSPMEHQAQPVMSSTYRSGNLVGWQQYRKTLPGEIRQCQRLEKKAWRR